MCYHLGVWGVFFQWFPSPRNVIASTVGSLLIEVTILFSMKINFVEMCVQDPVITFEHAGQIQPQLMEEVSNSQKLCEKQSSSIPTEGKLFNRLLI